MEKKNKNNEKKKEEGMNLGQFLNPLQEIKKKIKIKIKRRKEKKPTKL